MKNKIIKVIYHDGTKDSVIEALTFEQIKNKYQGKTSYEITRFYERQFISFERRLLENISDPIIKDYAINNFDLVEEEKEECNCNDISDYEDFELISELARRNVFGYSKTDIITIDLFERFSSVLTKAVDNQEIEDIITNLEIKYNLK